MSADEGGCFLIDLIENNKIPEVVLCVVLPTLQ